MRKLDPKQQLYDRGALNTAQQLATALERKEMFGSGQSTGSEMANSQDTAKPAMLSRNKNDANFINENQIRVNIEEE